MAPLARRLDPSEEPTEQEPTNPKSKDSRPALTLLDAVNEMTDTLGRLSRVDAEEAVAGLGRSWIPDRIIPKRRNPPVDTIQPTPAPKLVKASNQCRAILEDLEPRQAKVISAALDTTFDGLPPETGLTPG